jgi:bifunctional DNA-binding transcriptional regulator/antitoxin component of YhaV-PrlF toxin-antitoxin module
MLSTVTGKNQVTIPAALARKFHIEPGAQLEWAEGAGARELRVRIRPGPGETLRQIKKMGAKYAAVAPDAAVVLRAMREEDDTSAGPAKRARRDTGS